jgi:hypothetical protein
LDEELDALGRRIAKHTPVAYDPSAEEIHLIGLKPVHRPVILDRKLARGLRLT